MEWHDFGTIVRKRREELGISQQEIGVALGIDQAKVSLIERGARRVDVIKELPALARVLRLPISRLCEQNDAGPSEESDDPISALLKVYLPDVQFEDFEKRKLGKFLESFLKTYANTMEPQKKASNE